MGAPRGIAGELGRPLSPGEQRIARRLQAEELRKKGFSYEHIAARLGVAPMTVYYWLNGRATQGRARIEIEELLRRAERAIAEADEVLDAPAA